MQNYDSHDASSLQAILYVDDTGGPNPQKRRPHRLPNLAAISLCIVTAACAVSAVTLKMKHQAPIAYTVAPPPLRVMHPASRQYTQAVPHPQLTHVSRPVSRTHVHVSHIAAPAKNVALLHAHPLAVHVAMHKPVIPIQIHLAPKKVVALAPHRLIEVKHTLHRHHLVLHRRLAASGPPLAATHNFAIIASGTTAVSDPVITRFSAGPTTIPQGSGATLCVAAHHASQLSISGVGEVDPLLLDCRHVSPTVTTTYTAWAVNNLGVTVSQSVTVTVTH